MWLRLVVNPTASSVSGRTRTRVMEALKAEHQVDVAETSRRGDAIALAREASNLGVDVVVVLGGDGTLNEAADGLRGTGTALAALPGGSTNVFARTVGTAHDAVEATGQLLRSLAAGARRRIGLGVVHALPTSSERPFLFHAGAGFDAAVVRQMERMEQGTHFKRHFAHPAFAVVAVDTWLHHYDRDTKMALATDGEVIACGPFAVVSNSDPYTYVLRRRLSLAPEAGFDRPLAVTVFHHLRMSLLLRSALSGLASGRFLASTPDITRRADLSGVSISGDRTFGWQVDGDYLGEADRLEVRYEPATLTIVVP